MNHYMHARNHGCRIRQFTTEAGRTVSLENNLIRLVVLQDKGADISEFIYKPQDVDFMWHSYEPPRGKLTPVMPDLSGNFMDYYHGGWQELFPNIGAPCKVKGVSYGMHGEVCLLPWELEVLCDEVDKITVRFSTRTLRTPYYVEKVMTLVQDSPVLEVQQAAVNEAHEEMQLAWGQHPALGMPFLDEHCHIELDGATVRTMDTDYGDASLIDVNMNAQWPLVPGKDGGTVDLSQVRPMDSRTYMEFALCELKTARYVVKNRRLGLGFGMEWDKSVYPYLWVWQMFGGGFGAPFFGRAYTLALEPWSSVPAGLDRAVQSGTAITLAPGQRLNTWFRAFAEV